MLTQAVVSKDHLMVRSPFGSVPFQPTMDGLFSSGANPHGFYVAPGGRDLTRVVLERLVHFLHEESRSSVTSLRGEPASSCIGSLYWVDSGNSFDPYYVSQLSAQRGLDPRRVLRAIRVARPFTAYQFQRILADVPEAPILFSSHTNPASDTRPSSSIEEGDGLARHGGQALLREGGVRRCVPLVVLSDLMSLFYDDELPDRDCERAFREFLWQIESLSQRAVVVALLFKDEVPVKRQALLPKILETARLLSVTNRAVIPASRFDNQNYRRDVTSIMDHRNVTKAGIQVTQEASSSNVVVEDPLILTQHGFPIKTFGNDERCVANAGW